MIMMMNITRSKSCVTIKIDWRKWNCLSWASEIKGIHDICFQTSQRLYTQDGTHFFILYGGASGKELACQYRRHKRHGFDPWVGKSPLKESMATHCSILAQRIPMDREAQQVPSTRSQRVGQNWSKLAGTKDKYQHRKSQGDKEQLTSSSCSLHFPQFPFPLAKGQVGLQSS